MFESRWLRQTREVVKDCGNVFANFRVRSEQAKVGVSPGIDFGSGGEGFLRFSYATSLENIKEGLDRLERYLLKHF